MKRYLVMLLMLVDLQIGCSPQNVNKDKLQPETQQERIVAEPRVLLTSDFEKNRHRFWEFGDFEVRNPRSTDASVKVSSKSCSCFQVKGIPDVLGPYEKERVNLLVELGPKSESQSYQAVLVLQWPDKSQRYILIQQSVQLLSSLEVYPSAFSFSRNDLSLPELEKSFTVTFRYRHDEQKRIPPPYFPSLPDFVTGIEFLESRQQQLADGIWEVSWEGHLVGHTTAELSSNDTTWITCVVSEDPEKLVSVSIPLSTHVIPSGVTAHPKRVYLNGPLPKQVVLRSWKGQPFSVSSHENASLPIRVKVNSTDHKQFHKITVSLNGNNVQPGTYRVVLATSHPESPDVEFQAVVSERR